MQKRHWRGAVSDIDGLFFDVGAQFDTQGLIGHKIDATTGQVLEMEQDTKCSAPMSPDHRSRQ